MSHDWARVFGGVEALDAKINEVVTRALKEPREPDPPYEEFTVPVASPALTYDSLLETLTVTDQIHREIRKAQQADMARLERAHARAVEAGEGLMVAVRDGRVVYAEPSPYVPEKTAYWADLSNDSFTSGYAPDMDIFGP